MRILAASDIHDNKSAVKNLAKKALEEKVDLIILAGDIFSYDYGDKDLLQPLEKLKNKILFVPGNCESDEEYEYLKKGCKSINGYYVSYGDVGIAGIGCPNWTLSHKDEDFSIIERQFKRMKSKKKILVSHLHAQGTKAEFSGIEGEKILRKAIKKFKPDLFIAGHIHEAEGIEDKIGKTKILQVGKKGKIIEI
jgi:putative phosphoesterase